MTLEQEVARKRRNTNVQHAVLGVLTTAGILATGGLAAALIGSFGRAFNLPRPDNLQSATRRLAHKGFIMFSKRNGSVYLTLTPRGKQYITSVENKKIKKPRRWDKKLRVVIFDIPEKRKKLRDVLRHKLVGIGFMRLQDSVWVYPYDCEELIILLKTDYKLRKEVLYMIVEKLEYDKPVRAHFGLP